MDTEPRATGARGAGEDGQPEAQRGALTGSKSHVLRVALSEPEPALLAADPGPCAVPCPPLRRSVSPGRSEERPLSQTPGKCSHGLTKLSTRGRERPHGGGATSRVQGNRRVRTRGGTHWGPLPGRDHL